MDTIIDNWTVCYDIVSPENITVSWKRNLVFIWDKERAHSFSFHLIIALIITDNNRCRKIYNSTYIDDIFFGKTVKRHYAKKNTDATVWGAA